MISGNIDSGGDRDWYRFYAEAGEKYVLELFDVSKSLATSTGDSCQRNYNYLGLGLSVLNPSQSRVAMQCDPSWFRQCS